MEEPSNYSIIDIFGRVVQEGVLNDQISVASLEPGIYTLCLTSRKNKSSVYTKFIKNQ